MLKMSIDNCWRQSKELRVDIMSSIRDIFKEINNLIRLQNELIRMQSAETEVIMLSDMEVEVNEASIYEKQEEIKECKSNIKNKIYTMEIAMLNDSDLIYMAQNELEDEIDNNKSETEYCKNEIDELKGDMEEN